MNNAEEKIPPRFLPALERLDGEVSLLCEMAAITAEDLPEVKRNTEQALDAGDCELAASGLHKLKGMLSTFDSDGVVLDIQEALDAARKNQIDVARQCYRDHRDEVEALIKEIERLASHG